MRLKDRPHIRRAVRSLSLSFLICSMIFMIPFIYFLEQNYSIFLNLATQSKPSLLQYLEREIIWLRMFLIFAGIATFACITFISYRMMKFLSTPFALTEEHFESMEKYQNWSLTPPRVFSEEMDQRFLAAYRRHHQYLNETLENDLKLLNSIKIIEMDRASQFAVESLKKNYHSRLGKLIPKEEARVIEIFSKSSATDSSRRVS